MSDKELRPQDEAEKPEKKRDNSIAGSRQNNTRMIIWGVGGAYLLYLAVKMLKDFFGGLVEGRGTKIMVIVSSILFITVAVYLLVQCIRYAIGSFKESVSNMEQADEDDDDTTDPVEAAQDNEDDDSH